LLEPLPFAAAVFDEDEKLLFANSLLLRKCAVVKIGALENSIKSLLRLNFLISLPFTLENGNKYSMIFDTAVSEIEPFLKNIIDKMQKPLESSRIRNKMKIIVLVHSDSLIVGLLSSYLSRLGYTPITVNPDEKVLIIEDIAKSALFLIIDEKAFPKMKYIQKQIIIVIDHGKRFDAKKLYPNCFLIDSPPIITELCKVISELVDPEEYNNLFKDY
jgi:hypothetical protein